jgi:beta-lactamase superfamily II metal-dependent hydrolase
LGKLTTSVVKPADNELEVSIFGPGVGESVVLHLGGGRWMVIDSCLNPKTKQPAALEYLRSLGVVVERDVVAVIVTHWHDDHTRGASEVLKACTAAEFWCSAALSKREFFELVASAGQLSLRADDGSGIDEMNRVFDVLKKRPSPSRGRVVSPTYAGANSIVYRRPATDDVPACAVEALSPSSVSQTRGLLSFAPKLREPKRSIPNPGPNELSVALHVQFGSTAALLGADLEVGSSDDVGWRAVVVNPRIPAGKATIVKVPHHGSAGADHPPIWTTMIDNDPSVGVTAFNSSSLPRPSDLVRLRGRTVRVFHASPKAPAVVRFDRTTERTLEGVKIRERYGELGHIRFRAIDGGEVACSLFGAARAV